MKWRADEVRECGACGRWTARGDLFPSGSRNPRTGETPMDNFVCDRCQQEARSLREVSLACDRQQRRRKAA
jgi:hypothetical protein